MHPRVLPLLIAALGCLLGASPAGAAGAVEADVRALLESRVLRGARVGIVVEDFATGQRQFARHAEQLMVPASNQKLVVAAAVLSKWSPAHRFETPVYLAGELNAKGVLDGALWIGGRGDPSLVSETMWKLAEAIRLQGVSEIRGGIGVDVSYFDGSRIHPDWEPVESRAYHAPTGAFAVNYSSFRIEVAPGAAAGKPVAVRVAPLTSYFRLRPEALTLARGGALKLDLEPLADGSGEIVRVRGAFSRASKPKTYWRSVAFPEHYAVSVLQMQLRAQGVKVSGPVRIGSVPRGASELLRFKGEPLGEIVARLNKYSNNFIAEQLTKLLGAEEFGPPATWDKGVRYLRSYLDSIGIDGRQVIIADGSGLSPRNRISPAALVRIIREAAHSFNSGPEFLASLPLGGLDGTLEDRMNGDPTPVRGKTGHLRHVSSLSGLLPDGQGRLLVFSVIVNGARGSYEEVDRAVDGFVSALTGRDGDGAAGQGRGVD